MTGAALSGEITAVGLLAGGIGAKTVASFVGGVLLNGAVKIYKNKDGYRQLAVWQRELGHIHPELE